MFERTCFDWIDGERACKQQQTLQFGSAQKAPTFPLYLTIHAFLVQEQPFFRLLRPLNLFDKLLFGFHISSLVSSKLERPLHHPYLLANAFWTSSSSLSFSIHSFTLFRFKSLLLSLLFPVFVVADWILNVIVIR